MAKTKREKTILAEEYPKWAKEQKRLAQEEAVKGYAKSIAKGKKKAERETKKTLKKFASKGDETHKAVFGKGGTLSRVSKAYGYRYKASKSLLGMASAFGTPQRGGQTHPGRPKNVYVHRSPFTGKLIPAPLYYKEKRQFDNLQQKRAEGVQNQRIRQYAQRGIPPQQIQQLTPSASVEGGTYTPQPVQQEIRRPQIQLRPQPTQSQWQRTPMVQPQAYQQQVQQLPNGTVIPKGTQVWKFRRGLLELKEA